MNELKNYLLYAKIVKISTFLGESRDLCGRIIKPLLEKALSIEPVVAGIVKSFKANLKTFGNVVLFFSQNTEKSAVSS